MISSPKLAPIQQLHKGRRCLQAREFMCAKVMWRLITAEGRFVLPTAFLCGRFAELRRPAAYVATTWKCGKKI